ncbi:hypothetical protein [Lysobacter enzymogenes]|uniref:non-homologous end-joining DNA ligase LigD n=1 Tax=Lysobacter enzymogenes TaxID=69 RepID=UPI002D21E831|nr:hypothetical protein [Lysobacter enzymogenes]
MASFSLRARERVPAAMPMRWEELGRGKSGHAFDIRSAQARIKRLHGPPGQASTRCGKTCNKWRSGGGWRRPAGSAPGRRPNASFAGSSRGSGAPLTPSLSASSGTGFRPIPPPARAAALCVAAPAGAYRRTI